MAKTPRKKVSKSTDKGRPGAKSTLSDDLIEQIGELVEQGNFYSTVFRLLHIPEDTFYKWTRIGRQIVQEGKEGRTTNEKQCKKLFFRLEEASARAEAVHVRNLLEHSQGDWKASAWYLERKHNDRWGRKEAVKIESKNDNTNTNIDIDFSRLSDEEIKELMKKYE